MKHGSLKVCFLYILFFSVLCFLVFIWEEHFHQTRSICCRKKEERQWNNWRRVHILYGYSLLCWIINTWCFYCTLYFYFTCKWLCQTETWLKFRIQVLWDLIIGWFHCTYIERYQNNCSKMSSFEIGCIKRDWSEDE